MWITNFKFNIIECEGMVLKVSTRLRLVTEPDCNHNFLVPFRSSNIEDGMGYNILYQNETIS